MFVDFVNGKVVNHSSKWLWIIETTTNDGRRNKPAAVAHKLGPNKKTPNNIDADGFKRADGKPIEGHNSWWKIRDFVTADVYDKGLDDLRIAVIYKAAVEEGKFGFPYWGVALKNVTSILKNKKGRTIGYLIDGKRRVSAIEAVKLARQGELDNVVVVKTKAITYLRTKPYDKKWRSLVV